MNRRGFLKGLGAAVGCAAVGGGVLAKLPIPPGTPKAVVMAEIVGFRKGSMELVFLSEVLTGKVPMHEVLTSGAGEVLSTGKILRWEQTTLDSKAVDRHCKRLGIFDV